VGPLLAPGQIAIVAVSSVALWLLTRLLTDSPADAQPLAFVSYLGFLMGVVIAFPLEEKTVDFDPRSSTLWRKAMRYFLCAGLVMGTAILLDPVFAAVSSDDSVLGYLLRYLRYALAAIAGILLGPILFVRLGLTERRSANPPGRRAFPKRGAAV
jgi:hypothetical protein